MQESKVSVIDILLAEDNEDDVVMMMDAFSEAKMINVIHVVNNGEEALKFLNKEGEYQFAEEPGLIMLDINMPRKNGFDVLDEIKKNDRISHIPVVMMTTSNRDEDIAKSYKKGACSYISKPVDFRNFNEIMKSFALYWGIVSKIPKLEINDA